MSSRSSSFPPRAAVPPPFRLLHSLTFPSLPSITGILFSPSHPDKAFISTSDRCIHVLDPLHPSTSSSSPPSPLLLHTFHPLHGYDITSFTLTQDSSTLYSVSSDRHVTWTSTFPSSVPSFGRRWQAHEQRINCVELAHHDVLLLTGGDDHCCRVWDLRLATQRMKSAIQCLQAKDSVMGVCEVSDLPYVLVTASVDGKMRWYDVRKGEVVVWDSGHPLTSLEEIKGGGGGQGVVLTASLHSTLQLWGREENEGILQELKGEGYVQEKYAIRPIQVGEGGRYVVSGTEKNEGLIRWDVDTGQVVDEWEGDAESGGKGVEEGGRQGGITTCGDWSQLRGGRGLLITGGTHGKVHIWQ